MLETENAPQQRPSDGALVLLDSSFRPVSYNAEAIRILTWPRDPKEIHPTTKAMEARLRPILDPLRFSQQNALTLAFQSGRRKYGVRIFTLDNHRKASLPATVSTPRTPYCSNAGIASSSIFAPPLHSST